jgi:ATP-dependent RNA circularization protein (DNA/RNA ligase family)
MKKYHKIQSLYMRDPETKFRTFLPEYSTHEFGYLKDLEWEWTEKIDGTNIRIYFDGEKVHYGGRTDNAQIPAKLVMKLQELFTVETMKGLEGLTLFGEGYGAKIQKGGGNYIPDGVDFILFDVQTDNDTWLNRWDVEDIAKQLNIKIVPIRGTGTIDEAEAYVKNNMDSEVGKCKIEGLVMRPKFELIGRRGNRIITKLKCKDFTF